MVQETALKVDAVFWVYHEVYNLWAHKCKFGSPLWVTARRKPSFLRKCVVRPSGVFILLCERLVHDRFFVSSGQIMCSVEKGSYAKGAAERVDMEESTYRLCFVCGMDNHGGLRVRYTYANEEASAKVIIEDTFAGYPGVVHGGIVTTLLDETMAKTIEHLGIWAVTASMEVRFRHPTPVNTPLLLLGRRVKGETRLFRTEATLSLEDGTVLAEANAVFVKSPEPIAEKLG